MEFAEEEERCLCYSEQLVHSPHPPMSKQLQFKLVLLGMHHCIFDSQLAHFIQVNRLLVNQGLCLCLRSLR